MTTFSKITCSDKFHEEFLKLNDNEKNTFSNICNKLLSENFVYGQRDYDENTYRQINRFRELVEYYFALIDYELRHDDVYKIYYLKSKNERIRVKLRKLETIVILILAKLYVTQSLDLTNGNGVEPLVSLETVLGEINNTKIYKNRIYKTDVANALRTLKKYKLIDLNTTDINKVEQIKILPTILYVVTDKNLTNIEESLKNLSYEIVNVEDEGANDYETLED